VDADLTPLAHVREGDGPHPLVLLHGFLGSSRNLGTLARQLAQADPSLSVLALDLRGHGVSPPLVPGADLATLARDVLASARALGLGAPLPLIGHSLGGRVALRACLLDAASVAHVTLLDITPSPLGEATGATAVLDALLGAPARAQSRDVVRAHFAAAGLTPAITEWLLTNLVREDGAYRWRIDRAALAALHAHTAADDLWPAVETARAYTLHCVRGGRSPYVSEPDARRLEAAGCPVDTVDGAGHFLHVERPADVLARIRARLP
jgi:pimeloyl-ACP methyl ester carboxylesterase